MTHGFDIKKEYWRRYLIVQAILYQHQHYRIGKMDEYKKASIKQSNIKQANMKVADTKHSNTGI